MTRIEELERRLAKDPTSKTFAQLAEEYRKVGRLEDAIRVCRDGLKVHPSYFSARVALGRALLEAGSADEAASELEKVLQQVPDNILAAKFLAEAYHKTGRLEEALIKYRVTRTLAPQDAELTSRINEIEEELEAAQAPPPPPPPVPVVEEPTDRLADLISPEELVPLELEAEPSPMVDDSPDTPRTVTPSEFRPEGEQVFDFQDQGVSVDALSPAPGDEAAHDRYDTQIDWPEPLSEEPKPMPTAFETRFPPPEAEERVIELVPETQEMWDRPVSPRRPEQPLPPGQPETGVATATLAELYASQGHLEQALSVYRELADRQPHDPKVRQRMEELALLVQARAEPPGAAPSSQARKLSDTDRASIQDTMRRLEGWLAAIRRSRGT